MITVFGSINMDLVATVVRLPKQGETVPGTQFKALPGGKGANQALAARRAGQDVFMIGAVGNDEFTGPATAQLVSAGIKLALTKCADTPTGTAVILVERSGENVIAVVPGANGVISPADADAVIAAMHVGDILVLQLEIPLATIEYALNKARQNGVVTVLNLAPFVIPALRFAHLADYVITNETEFEELAGEKSMTVSSRETALKRLHASNGQTLIVTLGAEGVIAIRNGEVIHARGLDIDPVDTVGAGDTFCGYFAAGVVQGIDFASALRRAAVAASLACLKEGAQNAIPLAGEVEQMI